MRHHLNAGVSALILAVTMLAAVTAQQPPAGAPALEPGAISGVVVDGTTNAPLAGVAVSIGTPEIGQPYRQVTDDKGRFVFPDVIPQPGGYFVTASKAGYTNGYYGPRVGTALGRRITLASGEWFSEAKVVMYRPSAIAGTITDERGDPVVGAYVRVLTQALIAGTPHLAVGPIAKTDDRGVYRLANLGPGKYVVNVPSVQSTALVATAAATGSNAGPALEIDATTRLMLGRYPMPRPAPDGRLQMYAPAFFPGVTSAADAQTIEVKHGEERQGIDIRLQPVRALRISGRVTGPDEAIPGLPLRLLASGAEALGGGSETATAMVDANGAFTFANVPAGRYTIVARRTTAELRTREGVNGLELPLAPGQLYYSGMVNAEFDVYPQYRSSSTQGSGAYWGRMRVDVADQDLTGVTVALQRGMTISGRGVRETPRSDGLRPLVAAFAEPANGDVLLAKMPVTGRRGDAPPAEGAFTIEGLMPGQYVLRFEGSPVIKSVAWNGRDMTYTPFNASEGADFTNVVVTFTDEQTMVSGSVRDAQGRPTKDATVIAFPVEREQWSNYGFNSLRIRLGLLATNGTFRYQNLPAGDYFIVAVSAEQGDGWRNPKFLEAASALASRVTLDWGGTKNVDVKLVQVQVQ